VRESHRAIALAIHDRRFASEMIAPAELPQAGKGFRVSFSNSATAAATGPLTSIRLLECATVLQLTIRSTPAACNSIQASPVRHADEDDLALLYIGEQAHMRFAIGETAHQQILELAFRQRCQARGEPLAARHREEDRTHPGSPSAITSCRASA
jgi:hypothetical protein